MANVGDSAHTAHGLGTITEVDTIRGRSQFRVAGKGFNIWVDETKLHVAKGNPWGAPYNLESTIDDGVHNVNEDNSTTLPWNGSPQFGVDMFRKDQTILPGEHEIDADDRLHSSDSLTNKKVDDNRPYPGPNPDLFAKSASVHYGEFEDEPSRPEWGDDDWHEGLPEGPELTLHQTAGRHSKPPTHMVPMDDVEYGSYANQEPPMYGGDHEGNGTQTHYKQGPGARRSDDYTGPDHRYRPAGLSDRYAYVQPEVDHRDPITAFRNDPDGFIEARNYDLSSPTDTDYLTQKFADYSELVDIDTSMKTAAWSDVRQKAQRLRHEGRVHIKDLAPDRIYATVDGDNGTYDTMISKSGSMGGFGGGQSVTNWHCGCEWGRWAFQRRFSFVGRLCSHAYAAYLDMQSQHMKANPGHFKKKKYAGVVDEYKTYLKDNRKAPEYSTVADFVHCSGNDEIDHDDIQSLYDYVEDNPTMSPERKFDIDYTNNPDEAYKEASGPREEQRTGVPAMDAPLPWETDDATKWHAPQSWKKRQADILNQRPEHLVPRLQQVETHEGEDAHDWTDVTKDDRETTGPDDIVHFSSIAAKLHRTADPQEYYTDSHGRRLPKPSNQPAPQSGGGDDFHLPDWAAAGIGGVAGGLPGITEGLMTNFFNDPSQAPPKTPAQLSTQQSPVPPTGVPPAPGGQQPGRPADAHPGDINPSTGKPWGPAGGAPPPQNQSEWKPNPAAGPYTGAPGAPRPEGVKPGDPGSGTAPGFNGGSGGGGGSYTVKPGDNLADIARSHGLGDNYQSIVDQNKGKQFGTGTDLGKDPGLIHPGDTFDLPGGGGSSEPKVTGTTPGIKPPPSAEFSGTPTTPLTQQQDHSIKDTTGAPKPAAPPPVPAAPAAPPAAPGMPGSQQPKPSQVTSRLNRLHYVGADDNDDDDQRPDTGEAAGMLDRLRELSQDGPDYQHQAEHNEEVRDLVEKLQDAGVDASQFVASVHYADDDPSDGFANFRGRSYPNWADEPFAGSGPDPKFYSGDSASYIDDNERPDFVDVTDAPDGDIIKFNDSRSKPNQGPGHTSSFDSHYASMSLHGYHPQDDEGGMFNPDNPSSHDWEEGSGEPFMDEVGHQMDEVNPLSGGGGGGEGGAGEEAGAAGELEEAAPLLMAASTTPGGGFSLEAFDRGDFSFGDEGGELRRANRAGSGPRSQVRIDHGTRGWEREQRTFEASAPSEDSFGYNGEPELAAYEPMADNGGADIVSSFQRSAGAASLMHGGGGSAPRAGSLDDFSSSPVVQSMLRTAGRKYSEEEMRQLEGESHPLGARNLPTDDDLAGTHYLSL